MDFCVKFNFLIFFMISFFPCLGYPKNGKITFQKNAKFHFFSSNFMIFCLFFIKIFFLYRNFCTYLKQYIWSDLLFEYSSKGELNPYMRSSKSNFFGLMMPFCLNCFCNTLDKISNTLKSICFNWVFYYLCRQRNCIKFLFFIFSRWYFVPLYDH